ncbi:MAG: RyR domain-containing protein [Armatimonadota bacterium]
MARTRPGFESIRPAATPWHTRARRWLSEHQWPFIGIAWLVVTILGFIGYNLHLDAADEVALPLDLLYRSLQLFVMECEQPSDEVIWQFDVARFLAPVVVGYTALQGLMLLFAEQVARLGSRFAKDHVIVCGLGSKGCRLARNFRDAGHRVIAIEYDPDEIAPAIYREPGIIVLQCDAAEDRTLCAASVTTASHLFAVCGDDNLNCEVAVRARELSARRTSGTLSCHAHVTDLPLCRTLREQHLTSPRSDAFRLDFFNIYESGARALLAAHRVVPDGDAANLLIVGLGGFGEAIVVEAARARRDEGSRAALRVSVVDREAQERVSLFHARFPHLAEVCEFTAHRIDVSSARFQAGEFLDELSDHCALTAVTALPTDTLNITSALTLRRQCSARGHAPTVIARVRERGGLQTLLSESEGVVAFPLLDETCRPEVLLRGVNEILARAIHEDYVQHELAKGHELRSRGALHPWDELDEDLKEANRSQADGLAERLAAFGYRIVPLTDWEAGSYEFGPDEIEGMARMEHERWCAERRRQGWKHGAERDNKRKLHPDLVPWEELPEAAREKDRVMVRDLPALLAKAGFQVERGDR